MIEKIKLYGKPTKLKITIQTPYKEKIWIQVKDDSRKNTYYTKRYSNIDTKGDIYKSNNGKFRIDYFDTIRSYATGNTIKTPARISQRNGRIEVSAEQFRTFTIPMRMAILLHEYSHYYLNKNPRNETEADLNGLNIYLKLGYPNIDIYNVFLNVFKLSPSMENKKRFDKLDKFVKNFKG